MKYSIDRIENNIAILEEITTGTKLEVPVTNLPQDIHEGSILILKDNCYIIDKSTELKRRQSIQERFNRLKKS